MQWEFIIALVIAIPVILFPVAFVWYLNVGGIYSSLKEVLARRVARKKKIQGIIINEEMLKKEDW